MAKVPEGLNVSSSRMGATFCEHKREDFMRRAICTIAAAALAFCMVAPVATAQQSRPSQGATTDPASNPDQELGRRFSIKADALPPPKSDPVAASRSLVIPYPGQAPARVDGFTATPLFTVPTHPLPFLLPPNNM